MRGKKPKSAERGKLLSARKELSGLLKLRESTRARPHPRLSHSCLFYFDGLLVQATLDVLSSGQNLIPKFHLNLDLSHLQWVVPRIED